MINLIKKVLISVLISATNSLKCISLKNQECKVREVIVKNNGINNPYSRVCLPDIVKNNTLKVFYLISQQDRTK